MSGGRREASKSIDVYADEESDEDASSSDSDARGESESLSLTEAAETLRELSLALCDAAIERRVIKKQTPKKRAKAKKPIGKSTAKTKEPKQTTPVGETARRALRARHAMKVLNYAEPSLKTKLRRPSGFDEIEERKVVGPLALSPPRPLAPPPSPENSPHRLATHHRRQRPPSKRTPVHPRDLRSTSSPTSPESNRRLRRFAGASRVRFRASTTSSPTSFARCVDRDLRPPSFIHPILFHPIFSIASETFARRSFVASRFV